MVNCVLYVFITIKNQVILKINKNFKTAMAEHKSKLGPCVSAWVPCLGSHTRSQHCPCWLFFIPAAACSQKLPSAAKTP